MEILSFLAFVIGISVDAFIILPAAIAGLLTPNRWIKLAVPIIMAIILTAVQYHTTPQSAAILAKCMIGRSLGGILVAYAAGWVRRFTLESADKQKG